MAFLLPLLNYVKSIKLKKKYFLLFNKLINPLIILHQERLLINIIAESKNIDDFVNTLNRIYKGELEIESISQLQLYTKLIHFWIKSYMSFISSKMH